GGNWNLEYDVGNVTTHVAIDAAGQKAWNNVMAITVDNTVSSNTNATSLTLSKTINTGGNGILIVDVTWETPASVSSGTYGGTALTLLGTQANGGNGSVAMYYMKMPATGTANVVVTMSGSTKFTVGATNYFGVDQTTPTGTFTSNTGKNSGGSPVAPTVT